MGCVRTGSELRAGWVDHTPRVGTAGTVAKIDLRLPYPPCVRPPLLIPARPLTFSPLRSPTSRQTNSAKPVSRQHASLFARRLGERPALPPYHPPPVIAPRRARWCVRPWRAPSPVRTLRSQ